VGEEEGIRRRRQQNKGYGVGRNRIQGIDVRRFVGRRDIEAEAEAEA
jgi:hypothetical protein